MPALDSLVGGGALHIADQNKHEPVKTLCGQALDKDTTRYFMHRDNFDQSSCKVCRGIYFGESWNDSNTAKEEPKEEEPLIVTNNTDAPNFRPLFGHLSPPVNVHPPVEKQDGS